MKKLTYKNKISGKIILAVIAFFAILFNHTIKSEKLVFLFILFINCLCVYEGRRSWKKIIVFLFILWSNYSIFFANYGMELKSIFANWKDNAAIMCPAANIILIFSIALLFASDTGHDEESGFLDDAHNNSIIVWVSAVMLVFICVYGFTRPSVAGVRGTPSPIYEYSIILFIMAFYYSQTSVERISLLVIAVAFVVQNIAYGGRATALQMLLCLFFVFGLNNIKKIRIIPLFIVAILIFLSVGSMRVSFKFSVNALSRSFSELIQSGFTFDTAYSAFYTSGTFIYVGNMLSGATRLNLFVRYLLYIVVGSSVANSNLALFTFKYIPHCYGGILPFFAFFYLGYPGVIGLSCYMWQLLKKVFNKEKSEYMKCLSVYIVSSVPRWYLYSPAPILRGILIFSIIYYLWWVFHKFASKSM